jgi:hypothetical protein
VDDVARDWGANGLAHLTGLFGGQPDFSRAAMLTRVREVAATLLAGRAAQLGLSRGARVSAGGATRLLSTLDGWAATTLSRADNVDAALPAAPTVTTCVGELGSDNARVNQMVSERSFAAC